MSTADDVLGLWFPVVMTERSDLVQLARRWSGGAGDDAFIAEQFSAVLEATLDHLDSGDALDPMWTASPRGVLALIVLLDQLPRYIWRNTPRQWAGDAYTVPVARRLLHDHWDDLRWEERPWAMMPMLHAEALEPHETVIGLYERQLEAAPTFARELAEGTLERAQFYRTLIRRFGRFPFRNAVLGRESTPEELVFLANFSLGPPRGVLDLVRG